ncbi:MAG TPA: R3H domain-containing nucleic acid-binding protein [Candidatus Staskawiczbacteria bacterium]|nr:R3H domain-containing nucleic acid-binding protein [Candidatus Staskawiczbacteria bacterium]
MEQSDIELIKKTTETFFQKATIDLQRMDVSQSQSDSQDVVNIEIELVEPQILIGEKGQTLFETQRLLKMILAKRTGKLFYLNLDINGYKKKKAEYLASIAKDLANEVVLTKQSKELIPMSAYERRVIHAELAKRDDVVTKSAGEGLNRHIVIEPK